ncbi:MAG: winged helix-turn-helix transcriptional regulator [Clostridiaceae bacterium]|nr:winged helix-turn-helix transcriptional regulator [Clostridiaceae bacterium]
MPEKTDKLLSATNIQDTIHILSDPTRIKIMKTLSGGRSLCAKDILAHFVLSQPTLSHHLNAMVEARLIIATKAGRNVYYKLSKSGIRSIVKFFESLIDESPDTKFADEAYSIVDTVINSSGYKKSPMLPKPKSVIMSPELPNDNIIKEQKSKKKKGKSKEDKKCKKKKKKN